VRQMMVATILCLYRGEADKLWLARLPSNWHAADAVAALNDAGVLRDWGRLKPWLVEGISRRTWYRRRARARNSERT
jgi:hypothetical protein